MSRETQYIGLTERALEFVVKLDPLPSDTKTRGMFDEEIPLRRWKIHPCLGESIQKRAEACIREVVQAAPWSSGPMIFTCLEIDFANDFKQLIYQWVDDPLIKSVEFDQVTGRMWV